MSDSTIKNIQEIENAAEKYGMAPNLEARFGRVDAVVHLVGGWRGGTPLQHAPLDDWEFLSNLLVRTVQHTSAAFYDALTRSGRGRFVIMSAKQAVMPTTDNAAYAAAKAAAEAWVYALAHGFVVTHQLELGDGLRIRTDASRPQRFVGMGDHHAHHHRAFFTGRTA